MGLGKTQIILSPPAPPAHPHPSYLMKQTTTIMSSLFTLQPTSAFKAVPWQYCSVKMLKDVTDIGNGALCISEVLLLLGSPSPDSYLHESQYNPSSIESLRQQLVCPLGTRVANTTNNRASSTYFSNSQLRNQATPNFSKFYRK